VVLAGARWGDQGLEVSVQPRRGRRLRCGACGRPAAGYDRRPARRWHPLLQSPVTCNPNGNVAVDACPAGSPVVTDRVCLPAGTYTIDLSTGGGAEWPLVGDLDVTGSLELVGAAADVTRVVGANASGDSLLSISNSAGSVVLRDLAFEQSSQSGSVLLNTRASATGLPVLMVNCVVRGGHGHLGVRVIAPAEQDEAWPRRQAQHQQPRKVEVCCDHHAPVAAGTFEQLLVGGPHQSEIGCVVGFMAAAAEDHGEKRRIAQRLADVIGFQVWVRTQDGLLGLPRGQEPKKTRNGEAQPADTGLAARPLGRW
jgi:hypothetical protein